jgi:SAM-dependent methyltransferase
MTDRETIAVYDAKAADYAARFGGAEPSGSLQRFIEALPPAGKVLDLGCGPGADAARMQAAGLEVLAVDASPEMVALAQARGVRAEVRSFDEIDEVAAYDGVWANFSLLHAKRADLPRHLAAISGALRPGGVVHIGMKTGTGEGRDALGRFYTYVTEAELCGLMEAAGLRVVTIKAGVETGLAGTDDPYIVVQGRKDG